MDDRGICWFYFLVGHLHYIFDLEDVRMIVTRTPLRVSFFGGGTDFPEWFKDHPGSVIGMAINKYVYVTAMPLSPLHPYRYRLYWSKIERCQTPQEIDHPVVRAVLEAYNIQDPWGFSIIADLPARNGLGSSSAFTVGFLRAVGQIYNKAPKIIHDVAMAAIVVERELLQENGGWQDQFLCAVGGMNRINFKPEGAFCSPIMMRREHKEALVSSLYLVHVGESRSSSDVIVEQMLRTRDKKNDASLHRMVEMVDEAEEILVSEPTPWSMLEEFGALLHEGWEMKKTLSSRISGSSIDDAYRMAREAGALGGKLCGAGGGGFLMMLVPPDAKRRFMEQMSQFKIIPIGLDTEGSVIVLK